MAQPALFVAHGSPTLAMEDNEYTQFLNRLGREGLKRPQAIVLFSAHWDAPVQCINADEVHETSHDFYGFPEDLYKISYPAAGDPKLGAKIGSLFTANNLPYTTVSGRGLDHGAWVILRALFPAADIPVVELSVDSKRSPSEQYAIGKMLAKLRDENVLIIGSGGLVHNLRLLDRQATEPLPWAVLFDEWIAQTLGSWDLRTLFQFDKKAPHAREAVPSYAPEHFAPLLYAMGAADHDRKADKLYQSYEFGSLSLNCWRFGGQ
ncbi:class III extradiol ring-cleavage dioxygenase [Paenibacillus sp. M1]|uniref:Class III extradiol ring-cleavage dioxygenase n=1 Tax=Paenibacillus haidiansis TaxID=1574488 RepID=A0ABU7VWZ9_9BACL